MTPREYVVDENGRRTAVILPLEEYEELLEDVHDLARVAERKDEPALPLPELRQRLEKHGLL